MHLFELVLSAERLFAIFFVLCISMVVDNTRSQEKSDIVLEMIEIYPIADTYLGFTWKDLSPVYQRTITKRLQKCDSDEVLVETQTDTYEPADEKYSFFSNLEPDTCYKISIALYREETDETLAFTEPLSQKTASGPLEVIPQSFTASFSPEDGQVHIESRPAPDASQELELCCLFPTSGDFAQVNIQSVRMYMENKESANRYMLRPYQPFLPENMYKCIKLENDKISPETIDDRCLGENNKVVLAARFKQKYTVLVTGIPRNPYSLTYFQYSRFSMDTPLDLSAWKSSSHDPTSDIAFDMIKIYPIADTYLGFTWRDRSPDLERIITKRLQKCDSDEVLVETQTSTFESKKKYSSFSNLEPDTCYKISIALYLNGNQAFTEPLSQKTASGPLKVIPKSFTASFSPEDGKVHIEPRPAPDASQELELCCLFPSSSDSNQLNTESDETYKTSHSNGLSYLVRPYQPYWATEKYNCIKLANDNISPETIDDRCLGKHNSVVLAVRFTQNYSILVTGERARKPHTEDYTQYSFFSTDTPLDLSAWKST